MIPLKKVTVSLGEKSYAIHISTGSWDVQLESLLNYEVSEGSQAGKSLLRNFSGQKVLLITDSHVEKHYYLPVSQALTRSGAIVSVAVVSPGESAKALTKVEDLYSAALSSGLNRSSFIIALGGGVVGDLAGFIAATYMRGIAFIQIPTSLLAQVDSSIGGKVAVNHPSAKNVVGAFHQPRGVLINIDTLSTLSPREFSTGMAELIKHGFIYDSSFVDWLDTNLVALMAHDSEALIEAIYRSCLIKSTVVSQDEKEHGLRAILNFGHTIGHSIEAVAGYGTYTHGEAVAIGMIAESYIAFQRGLIDQEYLERLKGILFAAGLPIQMPNLDTQALLHAMGHDKKNVKDRIVFVLPQRLGVVSVYQDVEESEILSALKIAGA